MMQSRISSSLLQFSVLHDLIEIITIYLTQYTFLIIVSWKLFCCFIFCVEMVMHFIFHDFLINIKFNQQNLSSIFITFVNAFIKYKSF